MITRQTLGALALLAVLAPALGAQSAVAPEPENTPARRAELAVQAESRLWLEGTSTLRDYQCEASTIEATVRLDVADPSTAVVDLERSVRAVALTVPVSALDCRNGTMNGHMRKALRAGSSPEITYRLTAHEVEVLDNGSAVATLHGELTIAGATKPVTIETGVIASTDGELRVQGSKEIVMTEFGVEPPRLMLGTLKVNPRVVVHFDMVLR